MDKKRTNKKKIEKNIVFTNGCFDILHAGHIDYLEKASKFGYLIVGLNSDKSMEKIKRKPAFCQKDRKKILEALKSVNEVIIFNEDTPAKLIKKINPDIYVKGADYTDINSLDIPIRELVKDKFLTIPIKFRVSSSAIIKKIKSKQ